MLGALFDLIANALVSALVGAIPERQPWRALVAALYIVGPLAGLGVIVWTTPGTERDESPPHAFSRQRILLVVRRVTR